MNDILSALFICICVFGTGVALVHIGEKKTYGLVTNLGVILVGCSGLLGIGLLFMLVLAGLISFLLIISGSAYA